MVTASELPINTVREGTTAIDMAEMIFGNGVTVTGATYYGDSDSAGTYSNGDAVALGVTPGDTGIIMSTGNAEDFTNTTGQSNQRTNTSTNTSGTDNFSQYN
ncbi:MAG: 2,3,4,5-tetrahydropyridine-2,6-carboxylate N-succinyltransferase, partial [Sulfitobacter sp.]|nr:2,3,4,5-tetrahydropyridine-2,6-carboxylate N-succinyltransferase [Sulfitobacter sp.]